MFKFMAIAMAAMVLVGGYSSAADSVPTAEPDTVVACCWGGGWRGGHRGAGWRNDGGWRHGGYRGAGYNQSHYYYGG